MFDSIRCHDFCAVSGVKVIDRFTCIFAGVSVQRIRFNMFMYSWQVAKLKSDHLPHLVWLDADLIKSKSGSLKPY